MLYYVFIGTLFLFVKLFYIMVFNNVFSIIFSHCKPNSFFFKLNLDDSSLDLVAFVAKMMMMNEIYSVANNTKSVIDHSPSTYLMPVFFLHRNLLKNST